MMPNPAKNGRSAIFSTFLLTFVLTIMPMGNALSYVRPDWTAICLIYWCLYIPNRIGVFSGFFAGLLIDQLTGTLLGQHALAFSIVAYIAIQFHYRAHNYPIWQQTLTVFTLLVLHRLLMQWIMGITGYPPDMMYYMLPALISALIWPFFSALLTSVRRFYAIR